MYGAAQAILSQPALSWYSNENELSLFSDINPFGYVPDNKHLYLICGLSFSAVKHFENLLFAFCFLNESKLRKTETWTKFFGRFSLI